MLWRPFTPHKITTLLFLVALGILGYLYLSEQISLLPIGIAIVIYSIITVLGCCLIKWNYFITSTNRLPKTAKKTIALTFDDGPSENSLEILSILSEQKVPATFFVIGKQVKQHPKILQKIAAEQHTIGNHTFYHKASFDWQSNSAMKREILACNEAISQLGIEPTNYFRPPFGVTNPNIAKSIQDLNMKSIGWSVRSYDTVYRDPKRLLAKLLRRAKNNDIILLHDTKEITTQILPQLIISLRQKGFEFVKL